MRTIPTNPRVRVLLATGALYLVMLLSVVAFGALTFRSLYTDHPPRPVVADEDTVIRDFDAQYREAYEDYRRFFGPAGSTLAVYLGIWTAAFGVWKKAYWQGVAALAAGGAVTVLALSLLPWVYFPLDQYAVPAVWIISQTVPIGVSWLLVTALGRTLAEPSRAAAR